jgi:tripartite-type tricarboxylate transporter receptor subunit TctC
MTITSKLILGTAFAALTAFTAVSASAQTFPTKPVRIITPFPVGSGPEGVVRLLADKLSRA